MLLEIGPARTGKAYLTQEIDMSLSSNTRLSRVCAAKYDWTCGLLLAAVASNVFAQNQPTPPPTTTVIAAAPINIYFGPRFQKDRITVYKYTAENSSVQTQNIEKTTESTHTECIMRFEVTEVYEDGSADIAMTYDRIFTSGHPFFGRDYVFDSTLELQDADTEALVIDAFNRLAASVIKFHANAKGEIDPTTMVGSEDACAVMSDLPSIQDRVDEFTSTGLANLFECIWRVGVEPYPHDGTKPWKDVHVAPASESGTMTITSDHCLKSHTETHAVVETQLSMRLDFEPTDEDMLDVPKVLESRFNLVKGAQRHVWDRENSEVINQRTEVEYTWNVVYGQLPDVDTTRTQDHRHVISRLERMKQ